jgi:tetratricopeptide (TPR) repeat protein
MQGKPNERKPWRLGYGLFIVVFVMLLAGVAIALFVRENHLFFMKNKSFYLINRGFYKEALDLLVPLHQRNPSDLTILRRMLVIHNHLRHNENAYALAKELKNMGQLDKEVYWALGIHSLVNDDLDAAKKFLSQFPTDEPLSRVDRDTYRIPFVQGIVAYLDHDYQLAEQLLTDALDEDGSVYLTHLYLAKTYINRRRMDQAKDILRLTIGKFPEQPEPYALLGSLSYQEGDIDRTQFYLDNAQYRGLDAYKTLLGDSSTTPGQYTRLECGGCFQQLVDGKVFCSAAHFAARAERIFGEILLDLRIGNYEEAKRRIEPLHRLHHEMPGVNYLMALISEHAKGSALAKEYLYKEMLVNPWNFNAYLRFRELSASDTHTSPAIEQVRRNLESITIAEKRGKVDFVFDKENNREVKALVSNGVAQTTMETPEDGVYLLTVIARGEPAGRIWPLMYVRIDDSELQAFYVNSRERRAYSTAINVQRGSHTIEIAFANDMVVKVGGKEEDSNLFIERVLLLSIPPNNGLENL